ncbi:MAG: TlpA disulfide reductase family protein [Anaerolineaceae bacterium]|nr:TlpA disulfide reductase family protein [Anaerolineaceae bacterium]
MSADPIPTPGNPPAGIPPVKGAANWRTTLALLSLAASLGLLLAALLVFNHSRQSPAPPAAAPASAFRSVLNWQAADFTLPTLSGEVFRLTDHRGQVVFLNFWETWCAPCRVEMPDFATFLAEQDQDSPLALYTINGGQNAAQIHEFYDELGIDPLPTLLDTQGEITALYGVMQLPQTFILDGDGVARARILGIMDLADMRSYLAEYSG